METDQFFTRAVPIQLRSLNEDHQPLWGSMSAVEMLYHLEAGFRISIENVDGEIATPEEKLVKYKQFLMTDKPFAQNLQAPEIYAGYVKQDNGDLEQAKVDFLKSMIAVLSFFEKNPEHTAVHSSFGRLNTDEWLHLHKKHIRHHFAQFGLQL